MSDYVPFEFIDPAEEWPACVQLSINMQMWLGVYVEPIKGDPDTYENEHRQYELTSNRLNEMIVTAKLKVAELFQDVLICKALEQAGATFQEASNMFSRRNGHPVSVLANETPYTADEDLRFQFSALADLHGFIMDAEIYRDQTWKTE